MPLVTTVAAAKSHLQISHSAQDDVIGLLLDSIEDWVAQECGVRLVETDAGLEVSENLDGGTELLYPKAKPILDVLSIHDRHSDEDFDEEFSFNDFGIYKRLGGVWDNTVLYQWMVTLKAGYTPSTFPKMLTSGVYDVLSRFYRNRGSKAFEIADEYHLRWQDWADADLLHRIKNRSLNSFVW